MAKVPPDTYERIKFILFNKLNKRRCYGGIYTPIERLLKSLPPHDRGHGWDVIDDLKKNGWVELHKNNTCASLSLTFRKDILDFLDNNKGKFE